MNSSQLIEKLNRFYDKLGDKKKYSFLITGNWGIGKTHTYNEFIKLKRNKNYYYSLFGISNLRALEKMILKDVIFPDLKRLDERTSPKVFNKIIGGVLKDLGAEHTVNAISPNNILETLTFRDLKFTPKSLICFDDFERCKIPTEDLMGFIERLKQRTNIVVLCNESEIENKEKYKDYKEKVIDFTYSLEDVEGEIVLRKLEELKLSGDMEQLILEEFKKYCKDNLRVLEKFIHLYRELSFDLEKKKLTHEGKKKLLKACFYVVCETELCLVENYIKKYNEKIHDIVKSMRNTKPKEKDPEEEARKNSEIRKNKYSSVYEFYSKNLCEKVEKYYLGSKENADQIISELGWELEQTSDFLNNCIKKYVLLTSEGHKELVNKIERYIKEKRQKEYYNQMLSIELYFHYLYLCEIALVKPKDQIKKYILDIIEQYPRYELGNYWSLYSLSSAFNGRIYIEFLEDLKNLSDEMEKRHLEARESELLNFIKKGDYVNAEKELVKFITPNKFPTSILECFSYDFSSEMTSEEWKFWTMLVSLLEEQKFEKLEELKEKIKSHTNITIPRRVCFLEILNSKET